MKLDTIAIKKHMAENNISYADLAAMLGVSRQNISSILSRGTCTLRNAGRIAKALGLDFGAIVKEV